MRFILTGWWTSCSLTVYALYFDYYLLTKFAKKKKTKILSNTFGPIKILLNIDA